LSLANQKNGPVSTSPFQGTGTSLSYMAVCHNLVPLVNIKIAGKWMFIPLKLVLIGIDPYPYVLSCIDLGTSLA
jgi:hypothetical protein